MKISRFAPHLVACFAAFLFFGCEATSPPAPAAARQSMTGSARATAEPAEDRPGLGTRWGETRQSRTIDVRFHRADAANPLAVARINYNDEAGIRAMAAAVQPQRRRPVLAGAVASLVAVELRDESGRLLPGFAVADRWFVIGERGRRYSIVVRNECETPIEVVLSVDGLDVIDGRPASFRKPGYVVGPHQRVDVQGFRRSSDAVAAFRFGTVAESYANRKYNDTRNVGVIGIAIFNEFGTDPLAPTDAERRLRADPFPKRFGSPPDPIPGRNPHRQ